MLKNLSLKQTAFVQALGVTLYCGLIGLVFSHVNKIIPRQPNPYFGPVTFLLLFITSALTCASIVFYRPYELFFAGKKKEAAKLVILTTGWLFLSFLVFFTLAFFIFS